MAAAIISSSIIPLMFARIVIGFVMQNVQQSYINLILSKNPGHIGSVDLRKKPDTTPLNHFAV